MEDELLSAYVDGELSETERAGVEVRLRNDPQARELVEELRAMSKTLRSLPRLKLGEDLREVVLQQELVHRNVLLEDEGEPGTRRWLWAMMAIAATFFLAVYMPNQQDNKQVAQVEQRERRMVQAAPHLVSPGGIPCEPVELVAEGATTSASPGVSGGAIGFDARADRTVASNEGGARGELSAAPKAPVAEAYQVHLSPNTAEVAASDFDKLLASHGIAMRESASDGEVADEPELVLIEAPLEDIQQIIAACSAENAPWKSPRVVGHAESDANSNLLAELQQATGLAANGVAIALDDLDLGKEAAKAEAPASERVNVPADARGWAMHLGYGSSLAKAPAIGPEELATEPQPKNVRVLFILHSAAE